MPLRSGVAYLYGRSTSTAFKLSSPPPGGPDGDSSGLVVTAKTSLAQGTCGPKTYVKDVRRSSMVSFTDATCDNIDELS